MTELSSAPCPWCAEPTDRRDRACPECGNGIAWCPGCGIGNKADANFCRGCRRSLTGGDPTEDMSAPVTPTSEAEPPAPAPRPAPASDPLPAAAPASGPAPAPGPAVPPAEPARGAGDDPTAGPADEPRAPAPGFVQALGTIIPSTWAPRIGSPAAHAGAQAAAPGAAPAAGVAAGPVAAPAPPSAATVTPRPAQAVPRPYVAPVPAVAVYADPTALGPAPIHLACAVRGANHPGEGGTLELAAAAPRATAHLLVRLDVTGLVRTGPVTFPLSAGQQHFGPALGFVAPRPGEHPVRVVATVTRPDRSPLGRWVGAVNVRVVPVRSSPVRVDGDVIVMGGAGPEVLSGLLGQEVAPRPAGAVDSREVALHADNEYAHRLAASCPHVAGPTRAGDRASDPGPVVLMVRDSDTGHEVRYAVAHGPVAGLGRGGQADPTWRVRPAPYNYAQHARLSGEHTALGLRDGLAWVTDYSRNGTWLNRARLPAATEEFLADGDELALLPDRAVVARVRLAGDEHGVHALTAHRTDRFDRRLAYLLTSGRAPAPVFWPGADRPVLWVRWHRGAGGPVAALAWDDRRAEVPADRPTAAGRYHVLWRPAAPGADERALLAPAPAWPADRTTPPEDRPDA